MRRAYGRFARRVFALKRSAASQIHPHLFAQKSKLTQIHCNEKPIYKQLPLQLVCRTPLHRRISKPH